MKQRKSARPPLSAPTAERAFYNKESGQDNPWLLSAGKAEILGAIKHGECKDVKAIAGLMNEWAKDLITEEKADEVIGLMMRAGLIKKGDGGLAITELGEEHCPTLRSFRDLMYCERLLTHGSPPYSVNEILGRRTG